MKNLAHVNFCASLTHFEGHLQKFAYCQNQKFALILT